MPLAPGFRLGAYEILALIGAGGMGEIYRARDTRLRRDVAIKTLPPEVAADPVLRARFEREARAVAALNDPHVVTIHDFGDAGGTLYIAFELIEGDTLAQLLAQRRLDIVEAVDIAAQIASGLTHAHEAGVIHRDLKPRNVMMTREGLVKLVDFGLGKFVYRSGAAADAVTTTVAVSGPAVLLGTVGYMAPEQLQGGVVDARSDQFVFGALLYEMLAGVRAFDKGSAFKTLSAIVDDEPPPLSTAAPRVPTQIVALVAKCLSKKPEERYPSTRALLTDLQRVQAILAASASAPHRGAMRRAFALTAATAVVVTMLTAISWRASISRSAPAASAPALTLAVLPVEWQGGDAGERAFWMGVTDAITSRLGALPAGRQVHVPPASEVAARRVRTPSDARLELGASHVLRGTAANDGQRVRVRLEVVEAESNRVARTTDLVVAREDRGTVQNRILDAVLKMIDVTLTTTERTIVSAPPISPEAGDFYLQGLGYLQDDSRLENVETAIVLFLRAVERDSKYASSYAGLGEAYWRKYQNTHDVTWADKARQTCERALGVDEREAAPHRCLATVANGVGDYEKAVEEYEHALAREPDSELSRIGLANAYERLGLAGRAEEEFLKAIRVRPRYWNGYSRLGAFYYGQRRYADAERMFRQVVTLYPDSWRGYSNLGALLYVQGRTQDAVAAYERSLSIRPNYQAASNLGTLYFFDLHDYAHAVDAFRQAVKLDDDEYVVWGNLGSALFWSGARTEAKTAYARAAALAEQRLKINPRDAAVTMDLAEYVAELGELDRARMLMDTALALAPADARLMFEAGVLYEHALKDRDKALEWLGRALSGGYQWKEVERSPALMSLRQDSRMDALRQRVAEAPENRKGA